MSLDWILFNKEIASKFSDSEWIPLKAIQLSELGDIQYSGYSSDFFSYSTVAFFSEYRNFARQLSWSEIIGELEPLHYTDDDVYCVATEFLKFGHTKPIAINLVSDYPQSISKARKWILNPDLISVLKLEKNHENWIKSEDNSVVVAREKIDQNGNHILIEIKKAFLLDYLATKNLCLLLRSCRLRAEHVMNIQNSQYSDLKNKIEQRNEETFEILIRELEDVFNIDAVLRIDNPELVKDSTITVFNDETRICYQGTRIETSFIREEWLEKF